MNVYIWKDVQGYEPTANTILYVPMEDDLLDHSLTPKTLTQGGTVTLTTLSGVKCASSNNSGLYADFSGDWTNLTVTGWIYDTNSQSSTERQYCSLGNGISTGNFWFGSYDNKYGFSFTNIGGPTINTSVSKNSWQLITATKEGTSWKMYQGTTLLGSYTTSYGWNTQRVMIGGMFTSRGFGGYMGGWVVENKAWTTDDIQFYYDISKDKYGL